MHCTKMTQQQRATAFNLKRGPSVFSLSQLEENAEAEALRAPMSVHQLPGNDLPTYYFADPVPQKRTYTRISSTALLSIVPDIESDSCTDLDMPDSPSSDLGYKGWDSIGKNSPSLSPDLPSIKDSCLVPAYKEENLLGTLLTALWDECADNQLFRYDLAACTTKQVPGGLSFLAQLNEGRASKKRATECTMDRVVQPFSEAKFNFKKAYAREVLFAFEPHGSRSPASGRQESTLLESTLCSANPNLVIINVSPIEYGHVLLVPRVMDCLPQLVDNSTVELALQFCKEADSANFRLGYNSLGAYASINHLHFQGYYLDALFPCELATSSPIPGIKRRNSSVQVHRVTNFCVNGFVLELEPSADLAEGLAELAVAVSGACITMQELNLPHNLFITNGGRKVFIWPQCFAERQAQGVIPEHLLDMGVNPACFEISGHILLKRQEDYEAIGETDICELLGHASLPEDRFLQLAALCF